MKKSIEKIGTIATIVIKYDYICFELGDIGKQLDNPNGKSYNDIIADLPHLTDLE